MIRTLLTLTAAPGQRQALIDHYRDHAVLAASVPYGCLDGELAVDTANEADALVTSRWPSAEEYSNWLESADRRTVIDAMRHLLSSVSVPKVQVIDVVSRVDWSNNTEAQRGPREGDGS